MRFVARAERAKYVYKPMVKHVNGGVATMERGLTARFLGHVFDSERAQKALGWTDEDRRAVERFLLEHYDFNRPNGFYLEDAQHVGEVAMPAAGAVLRCLEFFVNEAGESEQCPNEVVGDGEYCSAHEPVVPPEVPVAPSEVVNI